jgi:hypothetical protein
MSGLHLYDFGIFLELTPDEEERQQLENNIQTALSAGLIELSDAIDIREIKNIKLANQVLKLRRKKKQERDQLMQQQNIQAQAQANAQAQQVAAQAEVQKNQALKQQEIELKQIEAQLNERKMQLEVQSKMQLMNLEFQYNVQLRNMDTQQKDAVENSKEDRKDQRIKMQGSQQSELIDQRKNNTPPKNFESSGNDILGGGFDLGSFEPK